MTESDLDKLFDGFEDKAKREGEQKAQQAERNKELQKASATALKSAALPVLNELSLKINERGYGSSVIDRLEGYSIPNVELTFVPRKNAGASGSVFTSSLSFAHTQSGQIEMKESIKAGEGKSFSGYHDPNSKIDPDKITADWVRKKAVAFIEKVLKAA